ncbi:hypothetical protein BZA70DRAFT_14647 [Myxozyma melibiosi]|uniref:Integral membrane protein n=1 Tax=Myxozyma melibiosi TaxID=54550 RepID=A0ABR1FC85_9ASCO
MSRSLHPASPHLHSSLPRRISSDPAVVPALIAFAIFYASNVGPRLLNAAVRALQTRDRLRQLPSMVKHILLSALSRNELPAFWFFLLGSSVSTTRIIERLFPKRRLSLRQSSFLGSAIASMLVMRWHQRRVRKSVAVKQIESVVSEKLDHHDHSRTIDTTLFTFTSACDYLFRRHILARNRLPISLNTCDMLSFVSSSSVVMYAWFYRPDRLPKSYNTWITRYADLDTRLLDMLRLAQQRKFIYGVETGMAGILEPMTKNLGLPREYGDPVKSIPLPCVLIHENMAENCEMHAVLRFWKAFKAALVIYLPLNTVLQLRNLRSRTPILAQIAHVLKSSARSSSFLGLFVTLTWYGVCLTRSRLGPYFFPKAKPITWDNTLGPLLGCLICGWSILLETPQRWGELAQFVSPRAIGTLLPVSFDEAHEWFESLVFSASYAVLFSALSVNRSNRRLGVREPNDVRLRGMMGYALTTIMR